MSTILALWLGLGIGAIAGFLAFHASRSEAKFD